MTNSAVHESRSRPGRSGTSGLGRLIAGSLVVVAVATVGVISRMQPPKKPAAEREVAAVNVRVQPVTPLPDLADTFELTAVVEPEAVISVAAEVAGQIERYGTQPRALVWRGGNIVAGTPLDEGQPVEAGDLLVELNTDLLQARYDRALAQFEYDQREYRRLLELFESGSTSRTELDDADTRRNISRATLAEAESELERAVITAPASGIVNRLPLEIGEFATPGDVVAEIVNIDRVKIVVDIPERDVHYLAVGQTAEIAVLMPDERTIDGEITYISELADELTRTTRIEITVDNSEHTLRSGQIVRARLTRRVLHDVIMIPLSSVIPLENGRVVYVADEEDRAVRREVELGFIKGRDVRVLSGLTAGEKLIITGHRYVGPLQPINIIDADAPSNGAGDTQ